MRKPLGLLAMAYMISSLDSTSLFSDEDPKPFPKEPKKIIPKGMEEYHFSDGFSCLAINAKVAQKKHEKFKRGNI